MTSKEKARELKDKFQKQIFFDVTDEKLDINEAKGLALLAVNEILDILWHTHKNESEYRYWQEVKQQIEQL